MKTKMTITSGGVKEWRLPDGRLHRDGDLPACIYPNGRKEWYQNGARHRASGYAQIDGSNKWWFQNGLFHRIGGAAVEYADGGKCYYIDGTLFDNEAKYLEACSKLPKSEQKQQSLSSIAPLFLACLGGAALASFSASGKNEERKLRMEQ